MQIQVPQWQKQNTLIKKLQLLFGSALQKFWYTIQKMLGYYQV